MADASAARRTVFLDRDGVINRKAHEGSYVRGWSEFVFLPGAVAGMAQLARAGADIIVVSNQRGVARGAMSHADVDEIHDRMCDELLRHGVTLAGVYVCPHEAGTCDCRKPGVGLFTRARADHPWIRFEESDMVGDAVADMEAGARLGMRLWLVGPARRRRRVAAETARRRIPLAGEAASLRLLVPALVARAPTAARHPVA